MKAEELKHEMKRAYMRRIKCAQQTVVPKDHQIINSLYVKSLLDRHGDEYTRLIEADGPTSTILFTRRRL